MFAKYKSVSISQETLALVLHCAFTVMRILWAKDFYSHKSFLFMLTYFYGYTFSLHEKNENGKNPKLFYIGNCYRCIHSVYKSNTYIYVDITLQPQNTSGRDTQEGELSISFLVLDGPLEDLFSYCTAVFFLQKKVKK